MLRYNDKTEQYRVYRKRECDRPGETTSGLFPNIAASAWHYPPGQDESMKSECSQSRRSFPALLFSLLFSLSEGYGINLHFMSKPSLSVLSSISRVDS